MDFIPYVDHGMFQDFIDYAALIEYCAAINEYSEFIEKQQDNKVPESNEFNSGKRYEYLKAYECREVNMTA